MTSKRSLANNPRFQALIEESRKSYREKGGIPLEDIERKLKMPSTKPNGTTTKQTRKKKPAIERAMRERKA